MANEQERWEVLPAGEMQRKYGLYAENRPVIKLDPSKVPEPLRGLVPLAETWGIGDDLIRADFLKKASPEAINEMQQLVNAHQERLNAWLAGPEADGRTFSPEYIAFTCLTMAADGF